MTRLLAALLAAAALPATAHSAPMTAPPAATSSTAASSGHLTPERVFSDPDLSGKRAIGPALSPDGKFVTFLQGKEDDGEVRDLWIASTSDGGKPRLLVDSRKLEPKGAVMSEAEKARRERQRTGGAKGIVEYKWDEAGKAILIPLGGDLYLADPNTGATKRLTQTPGDETDARFSPEGRFVSYVRDGTLYVRTPGGGEERRISPEGKDPVTYGVAEFVAQEEMGRFTGYWWAPGDDRIAYTKVDESGVDIVDRPDIGVKGTTIVKQRYPRPGRPNAVVELYVAGVAGGEPVKVDLGKDADIYLARVDWSADGRTLYVQRESRDQSLLELIAVDPATGAGKVILTEKQKPWIDLNNEFRPLKDGTFIWGSERTGFHHLYLYARDGKLIRPITHGSWPVAGIGLGVGLIASGTVAVDEGKGLAYFMASILTPLERNLYVVDYRHGGEPRRLTQADGWWSAAMPKTANVFIGSFSDPKTPPNTALYDLNGKRLSWIAENALKPGHPYWPYAATMSTPEFGIIKSADGTTDLHYALIKPIGFDPSKKYPAIVEVYGGPDVQNVTGGWRGPAERLYSEAGFVLFQLDNRGAANRGTQFAFAISGHLGDAEVADQLQGLKHLKSLAYVDPDRVGVTGWSYGGFMTLRLLTEPGAGFAAGAAGGPPGDWRLYDTHYTERFMGMPQKREKAYDQAAIVPRLENLHGRLLLMHGMADDNVQFENSTRIMARLQELSTPFDLMLYPGERHGIHGDPKNLQQWRTWLAFFKRELGGPR